MNAPDRAQLDRIDYRTSPAEYRHWTLSTEGAVATLAMKVDEDAGLKPGYKLKLNSYDLGVDIELHDALNRVRFEHPEVRNGGGDEPARPRVLLGRQHLHARPFEPRLEGELLQVHQRDPQRHRGLVDATPGLKFIAAVNGACAGGGYELALACDEILLIDDRSSAVSLPEVPLLGVLPGTGGLTRVTDKRKVRHDLADIFCTTSEGVRGKRAVEWRLVDEVVKPQQFAARVQQRAEELAAQERSPCRRKRCRAGAARGRVRSPTAWPTSSSPSRSTARARLATFTVKAPTSAQPTTPAEIEAAGAAWWPLAMARQLDDAILQMRTNELEIGTWLLKTAGDAEAVLAVDAVLREHAGHWLVRETIGLLRRTLARLDVSSRSLFALVEPGSCFAGTLLEIALAADRIYHLALPDEPGRAPTIARRRDQLRPLSDGDRAVAPRTPLLRGGARARCRARDDRQPARRRRRASRSASPPPRPTTSTGTTRSASRSRSAPRCRPTR